MSASNFKDLIVWNKSMDLVDSIYDFSDSLPEKEKFRIIDQMLRAVVSIPLNIAEGHGRRTNGDFARFLSIALGSCREVETLLLICERRGLGNETQTLSNQCEEIAKMLTVLIRKIRPS